jgi:hypothetical protein
VFLGVDVGAHRNLLSTNHLPILIKNDNKSVSTSERILLSPIRFFHLSRHFLSPEKITSIPKNINLSSEKVWDAKIFSGGKKSVIIDLFQVEIKNLFWIYSVGENLRIKVSILGMSKF